MTEYLFAFFGGLVLFLAGLGLYGVTAYAVGRRRAEIGVRMTLGAAPASIVRLVLRRVTALVALGIALGGLASLWTVRVTEMLLFGLTPRDPVSLVAAALVLAARIDPTVALRNE